ncbi:MAG: hypothetical protein ABEJ36_03810 [Candidatus Nanosalina sp.]
MEIEREMKYYGEDLENMEQEEETLPDSRNQNIRFMVEDFWRDLAGTEYGGRQLFNDVYSITDFGRDWGDRNRKALNNMILDPDMPVEINEKDDGEPEAIEDAGSIYSVLGYAPDSKGLHPAGAKVLHILAEGGNAGDVRNYALPMRRLQDENLQATFEIFYSNGLIEEEAYQNRDFSDENILTDSA